MKIFIALSNIYNHPLNTSVFMTTFKLIFWKINQLFFKFPAIISMTNNVRCICYPDSSFGGLIVYTTLPEYIEMRFLQFVARKKSLVIDVGAGIGDYSLIAASENLNNKVYSFEPSNKSYLRTLENIRLNNLSNIFLQKIVISDNSKGTYFNEEKINEISHISKNLSGLKYESISLDEFSKVNKIKSVDLIKIDVEGAESLVLTGMKKSFKYGLINSMIIELNSNSKNYGSTNKKNFKLLNSYFDCYLVDSFSIAKISSIKNISNIKTSNLICIKKGNVVLAKFLSKYEN